MRKLVALATVVATVTIGSTAAIATGSTGSVSTKCQAQYASPATRHVVNGGGSLDGWAHRHGSYVGNILGATYACESGWQQLSLLNYLNKGQLHAPLPKGTVLWAFPYATGPQPRKHH